jgi:predicted amidohydrolase
MTYTAAAFQFHPALHDREANRTDLERAITGIDAALLVLPELCTTGYVFESRDQLLAQAETRDGRACAMWRDLARTRAAAIVAGFAERDGDAVYNAAALALPDGSLTIYRKTHLFGIEKGLFAPGDSGFLVVPWHGIGLGLMICYDWRFPESSRTLALRGAEVICHPSDLVAPPRLWKPVMQTRAVENRVYTITANRTGTEQFRGEDVTFHGCSQIVDVNGAVLAEADAAFTGWIRAELDSERPRQKSFSPYNDIFADRRPEYYER